MRIHIDLLDASERRHQGQLSPRFARWTAAWGLAAVVALAAAMAIYNGIVDSQVVQQSEVTWAALKPRLDAVRTLRQRHARTAGLLNELDGWRGARQSWNTALRELQRKAPEEMQFQRLDLSDDIAAERPKSEDAPPQPYRKIRMKLSGRAGGERPEDTVARFVAALRDINAPDPLFVEVSLSFIQSDPLSRSNLYFFELDAVGVERPLKRP